MWHVGSRVSAMAAKWEYRYESLTLEADIFAEGFNKHLNARAAEGWELASVQYLNVYTKWSAMLVWRR
jgi:hypothetical protein